MEHWRSCVCVGSAIEHPPTASADDASAEWEMRMEDIQRWCDDGGLAKPRCGSQHLGVRVNWTLWCFARHGTESWRIIPYNLFPLSFGFGLYVGILAIVAHANRWRGQKIVVAVVWLFSADLLCGVAQLRLTVPPPRSHTHTHTAKCLDMVWRWDAATIKNNLAFIPNEERIRTKNTKKNEMKWNEARAGEC